MWSMDTNSFIKFTIRSVFSSSKAASIWKSTIKWNNYTSSNSPVSSYKTSTSRIVIANQIVSVGNYVFYKFTHPSTILLSSSVKSIGNYAFHGCSNVGKIIYEGQTDLTSCGSYSISGMSSSRIISTPFEYENNTFCNEMVNKN